MDWYLQEGSINSFYFFIRIDAEILKQLAVSSILAKTWEPKTFNLKSSLGQWILTFFFFPFVDS